LYSAVVSDAHIDSSLRLLTSEAGNDATKTRHIVVGTDILNSVGAWLASTGRPTSDVVVCDPNTRLAAGDALVQHLRADGRTAELLVLQPQAGEDHLVCEDAIIDELRSKLRERPHQNAIAVGAGSINDVVKMASAKLERPYVCVATAASMNGYTSAIAAVLSRGVKRTLAARQAEAVFADIGIIGKAPAYLNRAGFGDLLSKPYSHADWLLSHYVRNVPYLERPARLLDTAYEALLERSSAIGEGESAGIATLTRTILLSGFTMAIAGTSSPASGGEHLVSHYWDMEQHCRGLPLFGLHGTQVGIATRISALLFDRLVALEQHDLDVEAAVARRRTPQWLSTLAQEHPRLTPEVVEEVREQIEAKQFHGDTLRDELNSIKARWPEIREAMIAVLKPSAKMSLALAQAGAADRPSAIGVDRDHAVHTLRVCRQIRSRYVALDLMDDLGRLHDWAADVVDRVEG